VKEKGKMVLVQVSFSMIRDQTHSYSYTTELCRCRHAGLVKGVMSSREGLRNKEDKLNQPTPSLTPQSYGGVNVEPRPPLSEIIKEKSCEWKVEGCGCFVQSNLTCWAFSPLWQKYCFLNCN
jgi:hypothetical protein